MTLDKAYDQVLLSLYECNTIKTTAKTHSALISAENAMVEERVIQTKADANLFHQTRSTMVEIYHIPFSKVGKRFLPKEQCRALLRKDIPFQGLFVLAARKYHDLLERALMGKSAEFPAQKLIQNHPLEVFLKRASDSGIVEVLGLGCLLVICLNFVDFAFQKQSNFSSSAIVSMT